MAYHSIVAEARTRDLEAQRALFIDPHELQALTEHYIPDGENNYK